MLNIITDILFLILIVIICICYIKNMPFVKTVLMAWASLLLHEVATQTIVSYIKDGFIFPQGQNILVALLLGWLPAVVLVSVLFVLRKIEKR